MTVRLKRVYTAPEPGDGFRVLVDRLWPRGLTKKKAACDVWLKDVAPSPELRKQWHQAPERFDEFAQLYREELASNPAAGELRAIIAEHPVVTLAFGARDEHANHAVVLAEVLGVVDGDGAGES